MNYSIIYYGYYVLTPLIVYLINYESQFMQFKSRGQKK